MALLSFEGSPHGGLHKLLPEWNTQPRIVPDIIIDHSIVGSASGAWFMFRDRSNLESHFIVPKTGVIWQLMDTEREADANLLANSAGAVSIETEDNGHPDTDEWTKEQLESLIWLHDKLARVHGIQRVRCPITNVASLWKGLGYHIMQGSPGPWTPSTKTCPGKPARIRQWEDILLPAFITGVTPEEEFLMSLTDAEQQRVLKAADQILGAVGEGQLSYAGTIEATLKVAQSLVNESRAQTAAVLAAIKAMPTADIPEQDLEALAQRIAALDSDLDASAVLDALATRLAA